MSPNLLHVIARPAHGMHRTYYARRKGLLTRMLIGTRGRQRGYYDLLSLGIGASIAIAFATVGLWQKREEMLSQQMAAQGDVLAEIGNSINGKYLSIYYSNLVNGTAIPGVANEYAPTMAELEAINVIPAGYSTTSVYGAPYVISLAKTPTGCVAPRCDIAGMVYIDGALSDPSTGRPLTLDDGAAAIGGDGGYSDIVTPDIIAGPDGGWSLPNPKGNVAGVLAMRVGYGSSGWSAFVRRDGSLPMEGDLNFKGTTGTLHNIANAATVNAQKLVTPAGNSVQVGSSFLYGDSSNTALRQSGAVFLQNSTGTAWADLNAGNVNAAASMNASLDMNAARSVTAGSSVTSPYMHSTGNSQVDGSQQVNGTLTSGSRLYANEYVQVNGGAAQGTSCAPNGMIGNSGNGPLFCENGVWRSPGGTFSTASYSIAINVSGKYLGVHAYCSLGQLSGGPEGGSQQVYTDGANNWWATNIYWPDGNWADPSIVVNCINMPGAGI